MQDAARPGGQRLRALVLVGVLVAALAVLAGVRLLLPDQRQTTPEPGQAANVETPKPVVAPLPPELEEVEPALLGGLRFVDVTEAAGLRAIGDSPPRQTALDAGAAVVDIDDDDDLDLLLTSSGNASGLYRNDDGRFVDITAESGVGPLVHATVAQFADVDGDRDLDAFVGGPGAAFGRLLVNDGTGQFTDRSTASGVIGRADSEATRRAVRGADFGDVDRDGDLDLVVVDWNQSIVVAANVAGARPDMFADQCDFAAHVRLLWARQEVPATGDSRLFLNDGSGVFTDRTQEWGLADLGIALPFTPQFHDLDADGWLDLAVTGDVCSSRLYRNERGKRFSNVTAAARVGSDENGMGSLIHDLDEDGRPDWVVTAIAYPTQDGKCPDVSLFAGCSGNRVYLNRGKLRFRDRTDDLGLRTGWWGWGIAAGDFANDGRVQVALTNGRLAAAGAVDPEDQADVFYDAFTDDPSQLFLRRDDGTYVDVAHQAGLDHDGVGHALVPFDYDRDGRLDLLIANAGTSPALFRNVTSPRRHWLGIRLEDPTSPGNGDGLGARIGVIVGGHKVATRWMSTSGSYQSQRPAEVHVGLGGDSRAVRVLVWWPGARHPQVVRNLRPDRLVTIVRRGRSG